MFTQWTDIIFRKFIAFVDISADFTYKSFLTFCFRFRFYIFLIIGVAHCLLVTYHAGFCHTADEHSVSSQIYILLYFQGHKCVDIFVQEYQSVIRTIHLLSRKFIHASSTLETKLFKYRERSFYRETVYIHHPCLLDNMVRIICLIDINCNAERRVCQLCNCIDDQSVILFTVI